MTPDAVGDAIRLEMVDVASVACVDAADATELALDAAL